MHKSARALVAAGLLAAGSLFCTAAYAGSVTLTLSQSSLTNDTDAAGAWQYEGGTVLNAAGSSVGTYIITRRTTTTGTLAYNTASVNATLFFAPKVAGNVPNSISIEGAWEFNNGGMDGSVSAASNKYHWLIGADAAAVNSTAVTLTWVGSSQLTVP